MFNSHSATQKLVPEQESTYTPKSICDALRSVQSSPELVQQLYLQTLQITMCNLSAIKPHLKSSA